MTENVAIHSISARKNLNTKWVTKSVGHPSKTVPDLYKENRLLSKCTKFLDKEEQLISLTFSFVIKFASIIKWPHYSYIMLTRFSFSDSSYYWSTRTIVAPTRGTKPVQIPCSASSQKWGINQNLNTDPLVYHENQLNVGYWLFIISK